MRDKNEGERKIWERRYGGRGEGERGKDRWGRRREDEEFGITWG